MLFFFQMSQIMRIYLLMMIMVIWITIVVMNLLIIISAMMWLFMVSELCWSIPMGLNSIFMPNFMRYIMLSSHMMWVYQC